MVKFCPVDGLNLNQMLRNGYQFVSLLSHSIDRRLVCLLTQQRYFLVDLCRRLCANKSVSLGVLFEGDHTQCTHAKLADHTSSDISHLLDVLARPARDVSEDDLFSSTS